MERGTVSLSLVLFDSTSSPQSIQTKKSYYEGNLLWDNIFFLSRNHIV